MIRVLIQFSSVYFYALGGIIYLFTLGVFSIRHRDFIRQMACYLGFDTRILKFKTIEMCEIIPSDAPIVLKEPQQRDGNVTFQELYAINALAQKYKPKAVFEIGTFNGRTALNLAANSLPETVVYTLDLPSVDAKSTYSMREGDKKYVKKSVCGELYLKTSSAHKIKQLYGDSANFDFSPYHNTIEMIFIDGAHSYNYVVNDSRAALKLIGQRKGIILWHDALFNEVADAIHHVLRESNLTESCRLVKGTTLAFALINRH